jgi:crotonobetainyl-CoA:carnitine CoA-transferase CaiB-like acyl-CoA transferase
MSFADVRVLEIGDSLAVAYCGLQFARWGAEVIVSNEHSKGLRQMAPFSGGQSLTWTYLTANKIQADGVNSIAELATSADILLTNLTQTQLADAGIAVGKDTVVQRILPFASDGITSDIAEIPLLIESVSGSLMINGDPNRPPARTPGNMIAYIAGVSAFGAAFCAYHKYLTSGEAESIETSNLDVMTTISPMMRSQYTEGKFDARHNGPFTGVRLFAIGDGYVAANLFGKTTFSTVLEQLGIAQDEVPEDLDTPEKRYDLDALNAFLRDKTRGTSAEALFKQMLSLGLPPIGLYLEPKQLPDNEQLQALDFFEVLTLPDGKTVPYPGYPARFGQLHPKQPQLAQADSNARWHGARVVSKKILGHGQRPLEGIRIIDFTQAWIGPFASMMLADLGADVIKIESHKRVDVWRMWRNTPLDNVPNPDAHPYNTSGNFNGANRNKREIAVDLTHEAGVQIVRDLIATADVVMDNYTPRVMKKFGLDYESLRSIKEDIICVAWSGYGKEGPYADFKANGTTIEAIAGWDALFGYHDADPLVMGFYQADAITGLQMAACTSLALVHRDLTGEGQLVDGSMLEAAIPYIGEEVLSACLGNDAVRWGNRHPNMVPHGIFPCTGVDKWLALACRHDRDWANLRQVVGIDEELPSRTQRRDREDDIERLISQWTSRRTREAAEQELRAANVPALAVITVLESLVHPEFTSRDWFRKQTHPDMGEYSHVGFPWRFSHSTLRADRPAPRIGENTEEILQMLGYDAKRITSLFDRDIVGSVFVKPPVGHPLLR